MEGSSSGFFEDTVLGFPLIVGKINVERSNTCLFPNGVLFLGPSWSGMSCVEMERPKIKNNQKWQDWLKRLLSGYALFGLDTRPLFLPEY